MFASLCRWSGTGFNLDHAEVLRIELGTVEAEHHAGCNAGHVHIVERLFDPVRSRLCLCPKSGLQTKKDGASIRLISARTGIGTRYNFVVLINQHVVVKALCAGKERIIRSTHAGIAVDAFPLFRSLQAVNLIVVQNTAEILAAVDRDGTHTPQGRIAHLCEGVCRLQETKRKGIAGGELIPRSLASTVKHL